MIKQTLNKRGVSVKVLKEIFMFSFIIALNSKNAHIVLIHFRKLLIIVLICSNFIVGIFRWQQNNWDKTLWKKIYLEKQKVIECTMALVFTPNYVSMMFKTSSSFVLWLLQAGSAAKIEKDCFPEKKNIPANLFNCFEL